MLACEAWAKLADDGDEYCRKACGVRRRLTNGYLARHFHLNSKFRTTTQVLGTIKDISAWFRQRHKQKCHNAKHGWSVPFPVASLPTLDHQGAARVQSEGHTVC